MIRYCSWLVLILVAGVVQAQTVYVYGDEQNDLFRLLRREGVTVKRFDSPQAAVEAATAGSGVFLLARDYPKIDVKNRVTQPLLDAAGEKRLRLYIEYPAQYPGLNISDSVVETQLERGVVVNDVVGLPSMALLGIHNAHVLPVEADSPLVVLAKVVGVDKAEYGLADTKTWPLLLRRGHTLISLTGLSNFETGRYGPEASVRTLWTYILRWTMGRRTFALHHWREDVRPMYGRTTTLPATARLISIRQGVQWFDNGRFLIHPSWKADWEKYGGNGLKPVGPPVSQNKPSGDGSLGILEGHTSTILYDGSQLYRYWMRADVQGEASMTLAAAGRLLNNEKYKQESANILNFLFRTSNLRAGAKDDPASPAYGLIGWATTNAGTFYGDDNSRAILGAIAASAYLHTDRWDKQLAEAIMGNFRTTGRQGFRGERLEEGDIIRNGWRFYYDRDLQHPSPHFESWMWACYLWLYNKTKYEPLLDRTKEAIRITMESYPDKWLWGSSLQTQRARMILPLAWLIRIEDTEEHRRWLDRIATDMLSYQDSCGAIREEIGKGKGMFKELRKNSDYGADEGSLIFRNGEKISCQLYTNNFALFSLNEAARATGDKRYVNATLRLSDYLTRIQVQSTKHKDLDGAWFRAFDYGKWDYWASNSDAGWGAWCTLTGWIQSWIVTTQVQIQEKQSFWELTKTSGIGATAKAVIHRMMK